ncbi:hypothetical protein [Crenothrix polyspora]|uniref:Uncharacterized protein n=1 Tax=Crenothrix polyspora TaxID=360316 RepID=A0A1R4HDS3_9GAMM|nr:hypothetical protein [Crenothrix polyspora]SJM94395.1 conserved hypothetical protein [Crenothrix polyspora]
MKINFTKKEYRSLLEAMQIADWVLHAHDNTESRSDTKAFGELFHKLLALANQIGCEDLVELEEEDNKYYPTVELESAVEEFIQEFENNTFWDELISRLSERDVLKKAKVTDVTDIKKTERFAALAESEEKWANEISSFGLDRICVDETVGKIIH